MFSIPQSFRLEDEQYLTLPALRKFVRKNKLGKGKDFQTKIEFLDAIEQFANANSNDLDITLEWLDDVLKEGIKDIYFCDIEIPPEIERIFKDNKNIAQFIQPSASHICIGTHEDTLTLKTSAIRPMDEGTLISLCYTRQIVQYSARTGGDVRIYPVFVDIDIQRRLIIGRAKSKAALYDCASIVDFDISKAKSITAKQLIKAAILNAIEKLSLKLCDSKAADAKYKSKLYKVLDRYTFTPKIIQDQLDASKSYLEEVSSDFLSQLVVPNTFLDDTQYDIINMAEKYLSISHPDKSIFTVERKAYPLKLRATDEEESTVEQTSGLEEPLQSKAVFFDNKKMLQKAQACDGVTFAFYRKDRTYYNEIYKVGMRSDKGFFYIKFFEFTEEEDILSVLFEIVDA